MKTTEGFKYFIDDVEYKSFDEFEKRINKLEIKEINVIGLSLYAKSGK